MKKIFLFFVLLFTFVINYAQTTVFTDDFSANQAATYTSSGAISGSNWNANISGVDWGIRRNTTTSYMEISNDASATANVLGWGFANTLLSGFTAPYTSTLSSNTGLVTWTFNMRTSRTSALAGFTSNNSYGMAFVISCTSNTPNTSGNGYAVVMGGGLNNNIGFIRFTNGLQGTKNTIIAFGGVTPAALTNYMSAKLTYNPANNSFSLSARDDGAAAFGDPAVGFLTAVGTATDATYTGTAMTYLGTYWQGSTTNGQTAFFDNVKVTVAAPTLPTLTTTAASSITYNSATSGGNITDPGTAAVTARGVVWATTTGPTLPSPNSTSNGTGAGSFTSNLTGLSASTLYYVRAYATNTAGTAYGNEITFTTAPAPAQYYNVAGSDVSVLTNWGTNLDGTGTNPPNFTDNNQIFNLINSGSTLGANTTISGLNSKLIVGDGVAAVSFTVPSTFTLTAPVDVLNNGTLVIQNATMPTLNLIATGSTIDIDGALTVPALNYFNLKLTSGANLPVASTIGVAGTFNPGTTVTATAGSSLLFNGTTAQTMPTFTYDSVTIANTLNVTTANAPSIITLNRGLRISGTFNVAAADSVKLAGTNFSSMVLDATKALNVNGKLVLKVVVAPTVTGTLTVNSGGKYIVDANTGNSAGFIPNATTAATYAAGSEILVLQGAPRLPQYAGGNVVWSSVGTGSFVNNATNTIDGNLTFTAGGVNNGSGGTGRTLTVGGNLIMNGGTYSVLGAPGSAAVGQVLNVNGDIIVAGGNLVASAGTLAGSTGVGTVNVKGNINHTSGTIGTTQTVGSGLYNFNGTTAQSIITTGFTTTGSNNLLNMTINNAANITLASGNIDLVGGTLTFTSGKLTLGANNVTANTITGGSATSYAVTNGTGALILNVPAAVASYNLPVGTAAAYRPATINFTAAPIAGTLATRAIAGAPGNAGLALTEPGIAAPDDNILTTAPDFWEVLSTATGGTYTATFTGNGQTGVSDFAKTTLLKRPDASSNWVLEGTYVATTGSNAAPVLSRIGLTSFSQFAIGGGSTAVLPLTLLSFTATTQGNLVNLTWKTAQEINIAKYAIEKSTNGTSFSIIGEVAARNSYSNQYHFTDALVASTTFYRLKIVGNDGSIKYSKIIAINTKQNSTIALFPNPTSSNLFITHKKAQANASVQVIATDGSTMFKMPIEANSTTSTIDVSTLANGVYKIVYQNGTEKIQQSFLKK